jgi:hypothetical protein
LPCFCLLRHPQVYLAHFLVVLQELHFLSITDSLALPHQHISFGIRKKIFFLWIPCYFWLRDSKGIFQYSWFLINI